MNRSLIADRYAKALFKLADERANLEQVSKDMALLQSYCDEASNFAELINSPVIQPSQKKKMIHSVLDGNIDKITLNLLDLLFDNKREMFLEDINRRFISLYKEKKGIKAVVIYSAIALEEDYVSNVKSYLEEQFKVPVELAVKNRPDLLGGFILTVDGKMVDASLSSKLKEMKQELLS